MANAKTVYTGQDEYKPPNLDEMFGSMNGSEPGYTPPPPPSPPQYGTYFSRMRNLKPVGSRMMTPLLIILAIVASFGGLGWYMIRQLGQLPDMQMSAANAVQAAPLPNEPQIVSTVRVGYVGSTAEGQIIPADRAKVYEWYQMSDGQLRFRWGEVWHCAPPGYDIPNLWLLSYDIETKDDTYRGMYLCQQ